MQGSSLLAWLVPWWITMQEHEREHMDSCIFLVSTKLLLRTNEVVDRLEHFHISSKDMENRDAIRESGYRRDIGKFTACKLMVVPHLFISNPVCQVSIWNEMLDSSRVCQLKILRLILLNLLLSSNMVFKFETRTPVSFILNVKELNRKVILQVYHCAVVKHHVEVGRLISAKAT